MLSRQAESVGGRTAASVSTFTLVVSMGSLLSLALCVVAEIPMFLFLEGKL